MGWRNGLDPTKPHHRGRLQPRPRGTQAFPERKAGAIWRLRLGKDSRKTNDFFINLYISLFSANSCWICNYVPFLIPDTSNLSSLFAPDPDYWSPQRINFCFHWFPIVFLFSILLVSVLIFITPFLFFLLVLIYAFLV